MGGGGGAAGMGGAVFSQGTGHTFRNIVFSNNKAQGGKGGDAVDSGPNAGGGGGGLGGDGTGPSYGSSSLFSGEDSDQGGYGGPGGLLGGAGGVGGYVHHSFDFNSLFQFCRHRHRRPDPTGVGSGLFQNMPRPSISIITTFTSKQQAGPELVEGAALSASTSALRGASAAEAEALIGICTAWVVRLALRR
jgi:hypothetical protein